MKCPKAWVDALRGTITPDLRHEVLRVLSNVGALKDPPKPREFWACKCVVRYLKEEKDCHHNIHLREVLDE